LCTELGELMEKRHAGPVPIRPETIGPDAGGCRCSKHALGHRVDAANVGRGHEHGLLAPTKRSHESRQIVIDPFGQHVTARAERHLNPVPADVSGKLRRVLERQILNRLGEPADLPPSRRLGAADRLPGGNDGSGRHRAQESSARHVKQETLAIERLLD
jgi:hypothetical protein